MYEEYTYEGYGPSGVAILVETLTDNKNRTTAEIRHIFSRYNGNLGEAGSVAWIFSKKGYLSFERQAVDVDKIMEVALEAGAEDVTEDEDVVEVFTDAASFESVKKVFDQNNLKYSVAQIDMVPQTSVKLEGKPPRPCLSSWRSWKIRTTCRTYTPTSIYRPRRWKGSASKALFRNASPAACKIPFLFRPFARYPIISFPCPTRETALRLSPLDLAGCSWAGLG